MFITGEESLEEYKELWDGVWSSATVRVSLVELDGQTIPNGEIILHRDEQEEGEETLYSIDGFSIIEKRVNSAFEVIDKLMNGSFEVGSVDLSPYVSLNEHGSDYFQTGIQESRVFEDRGRFELNAVFDVDLDDEEKKTFKEKVERIGDELRTANEPYFDMNKCQVTYFSHHFPRKDTKPPKILVFAKPDINLEIRDENQLIFEFPPELKDRVSLSFMPLRPYQERPPGQQFDVNEDINREDGRLKWEKTLNLSGVREAYIGLNILDTQVGMKRHYNREIDVQNERLAILNRYDQQGRLESYLKGHNPDYFEVAVLNLLATAGYRVQWYGDEDFKIPNHSEETLETKYHEIDLVAYAPDNSQILFVECTNKDIAEKDVVSDRVARISKGIRQEQMEEWGDGFVQASQEIQACIATPRPKDEVSESHLKAYQEKDVLVLTQEKLLDILEQSAGEREFTKIQGDRVGAEGLRFV